MTGAQFRMPFQIDTNALVVNTSLAEAKGASLPESSSGWTRDDWTEWDSTMTVTDSGTFGAWGHDDFEVQHVPQLYSNGPAKPLDDTLTKAMCDLPKAGEAWCHLVG